MGGSRNQNSLAGDTSGVYKASTTATIKGRRIKVPKTTTVLRGEHARNIQGSRNHKSKNDDSYAFYKEHTPATGRCRGITIPKRTTVLHFATTKSEKSQATQIEKSQATPGRSHKQPLYPQNILIVAGSFLMVARFGTQQPSKDYVLCAPNLRSGNASSKIRIK